VVITVLSLGADGGLGASLAAVVAGTMTVEAFAIAVAMNILSFLVVTAAVKLFVKAVGIEFAFIASLVAALMGAYQFLKETGTKGYLLAKDLLMLSSNLSSGIQAEVQDLLADVYREMSNFSSLADEQQKKLDEARDLLYSKNVFSPLILIGESPTDFYQRTVHSGNIGVLGVTAISSFVDVALTLPKINDTLGVANV
jgi:hypothetical protein